MTQKAIDIVKARGTRPSEPFQREKLHKSIHAACLSVRSPEGVADMAAGNICDAVIVWLETKPEVTSHDIRRVAAEKLKAYHPEAAYFYAQHKHIL